MNMWMATGNILLKSGKQSGLRRSKFKPQCHWIDAGESFSDAHHSIMTFDKISNFLYFVT